MNPAAGQPLHVAVVCERFDAFGGGNERSSAEIVRRLVESGHRVTVLAGACQLGAELPGASLQRLRIKKTSSPLHLLRFVFWAERRLRRLRPDVSLSMSTLVRAAVIQPRGGTVAETQLRNIARRGTRAARRKKALLLKLNAKQQLLRRLERRVLRSVGRPGGVRLAVAISGYARQMLLEAGLPPEWIRVVPNAADMPRLTPQQRAAYRSEVREGWGLPEEAEVLLFAAMNPGLKGVDTLLHAVALLKSARPLLYVVLAGPHVHAVSRTIDRLGIRDAVRLAGQTREMPRLYAASDLTVLPTFYDPASKVVLESMMLGVPAVTTRFNGAADWIDRPQRGAVIDDPADARGLAAALNELLDARRSTAPDVELVAELSMDRHVESLLQVLREAADLRGAASRPES